MVCTVLRRELFVVLPWEVSVGLQTGFFPVLLTAAFAVLQTGLSRCSQRRASRVHNGFPVSHGDFRGAPNGDFPGAPNGGFRGGPTAAAHNGHRHNNHHHGTVTRASWSASGFLVGVGAGAGVILTGIRPIIMLRTATTPTPTTIL